MQYRPYGKMGFDVSLFGMGCMRLPRRERTDGTIEIDREKAIEMIQYAADHGVNYFDTAYGYHRQKSESLVGEALAEYYACGPFGCMRLYRLSGLFGKG